MQCHFCHFTGWDNVLVPFILFYSSQESLSGSNGNAAISIPALGTTSRTQSTFTPSLALHFDENLIKHVQGWPSEHVEKQVQAWFFMTLIVY